MGSSASLGIVVALSAVQPLLLPIVALACVPRWLASKHNVDELYDFRFGHTPIERARFYLEDVLTARDSAKEVRAFSLFEVFLETVERALRGADLQVHRDGTPARPPRVARQRGVVADDRRDDRSARRVVRVGTDGDRGGGGRGARAAANSARGSRLDPRAEQELFSSLRTLCAGRAVLLISHRFSTVRFADRIYVLHEGRIEDSGTHDELMARKGRNAELFTLQAAAYVD